MNIVTVYCTFFLYNSLMKKCILKSVPAKLQLKPMNVYPGKGHNFKPYILKLILSLLNLEEKRGKLLLYILGHFTLTDGFQAILSIGNRNNPCCNLEVIEHSPGPSFTAENKSISLETLLASVINEGTRIKGSHLSWLFPCFDAAVKSGGG